LIVY
jgi:hypothetical protein